MIRRNLFIIVLAACLVVLSVALYSLQIFIFHRADDTLFYLLQDLAFLPLQLLLVGLIVERVLANREKQQKMQKMNMVVGAFFSEIGNYLLKTLLDSFKNSDDICASLNINSSWTRKDFQKASTFAARLPIDIDIEQVNLDALKAFLTEKRQFILGLLENPSLLEHDKFADLLWATTHVDEELSARLSLGGLPETDLAHVANDIRRMYDDLASEWVDYAEHLKNKYPYLFSLLVRTHPFQVGPSPIVKG
jgi:hypothetical protein